MEREPQEHHPYAIELPTDMVRDSEDIKSALEGKQNAVQETRSLIKKLNSEGKHGEASTQEELIGIEMVQQRVLEQYGDAT